MDVSQATLPENEENYVTNESDFEQDEDEETDSTGTLDTEGVEELVGDQADFLDDDVREPYFSVLAKSHNLERWMKSHEERELPPIAKFLYDSVIDVGRSLKGDPGSSSLYQSTWALMDASQQFRNAYNNDVFGRDDTIGSAYAHQLASATRILLRALPAQDYPMTDARDSRMYASESESDSSGPHSVASYYDRQEAERIARMRAHSTLTNEQAIEAHVRRRGERGHWRDREAVAYEGDEDD